MIEKLKGVPLFFVLLAYIGYLGLQFYNFNYDANGEVEQHKNRMAASESEVQGLKKKLVDGNKFMKSLDLKKAEIQAQVKKLIGYQGALSEAPDVPSLIKLLLTEAKKLGMKVDKIEPGKKTQKEYYLEQEFKLDIRGSYQQLLLFAARVAQLQRILRIDSYEMKPSVNTINTRSITLSSVLTIRAYQYTLSKEDQIVNGAALK